MENVFFSQGNFVIVRYSRVQIDIRKKKKNQNLVCA